MLHIFIRVLENCYYILTITLAEQWRKHVCNAAITMTPFSYELPTCIEITYREHVKKCAWWFERAESLHRETWNKRGRAVITLLLDMVVLSLMITMVAISYLCFVITSPALSSFRWCSHLFLDVYIYFPFLL